MNFVAFVIALICGLMLAEQRLSRRNEVALRAAGAIEPPGDVFPAMAILYPAAFLVMGVEGIVRASAAAPATGPSWAASGVLLFVASKALKYWAIGTLGPRWSFRVLVEPGKPLVTAGPYRYVAHPNYVGVVGELVSTAMMVGAVISGPVMTGLFGVVLAMRIRFESRVLHAAVSAPVAISRQPAGPKG